MKNHKSKILSLCIATAFLYGCNDDDNNSSSTEVQAYDGPVRGMVANYFCNGGIEGTSDATDDNGKTTISGLFSRSPELCNINFEGTANAIDMENGRNMAGVIYSAPRGIFNRNGHFTVSPLTTLLDKYLDGQEYNEASAAEILQNLGLDDIANSGISIRELLTNTEAVVGQLKSNSPTLFSKLAASKMILSDVISSQSGISAAQIAATTKKLAEVIIKTYPNFPINNSGQEIVVNLREKLKESGFIDKVTSGELSDDALNDIIEDNIADAIKPNPTDPDTPATGGTGGTGGTSTGVGA